MLEKIAIFLIIFFGYILLPVFLMFALPLVLGCLLVIAALEEFHSEVALYLALLVFPLPFLVGLILNIFAIPIALFVSPILLGIFLYEEVFRDRSYVYGADQNRERAEETLRQLLGRKDKDDYKDSSNESLNNYN